MSYTYPEKRKKKKDKKREKRRHPYKRGGRERIRVGRERLKV